MSPLDEADPVVPEGLVVEPPRSELCGIHQFRLGVGYPEEIIISNY